jgi:CheY-like chemotaxis protein
MPSARILLAEDNPVNQKLVTLTLTKAGHQVLIVNNGREAVEKYTNSIEPFDLIFMDIQMPEMDGLRATEKIRKWEESGRQKSVVRSWTQLNPRPVTRNPQLTTFRLSP